MGRKSLHANTNQSYIETNHNRKTLTNKKVTLVNCQNMDLAKPKSGVPGLGCSKPDHHEPELTGSSKIRQVPLLWVDVIYLLGCCHRNNFAVQLWFALIAFNESNCAQK